MSDIVTGHPDRLRTWSHRTGRLRARLARWRADRRPASASLDLVVAGQRWLAVDAWVSMIDGAVVVEIDTSALKPDRRCRVRVNDGPVFDAVPDSGDHDIEHLADYLTELSHQEHLAGARAAETRQTEQPDLPE
ncbi:hypothetical protein [Nocardia asteroides]